MWLPDKSDGQTAAIRHKGWPDTGCYCQISRIARLLRLCQTQGMARHCMSVTARQVGWPDCCDNIYQTQGMARHWVWLPDKSDGQTAAIVPDTTDGQTLGMTARQVGWPDCCDYTIHEGRPDTGCDCQTSRMARLLLLYQTQGIARHWVWLPDKSDGPTAAIIPDTRDGQTLCETARQVGWPDCCDYTRYKGWQDTVCDCQTSRMARLLQLDTRDGQTLGVTARQVVWPDCCN